MDIQLYLDTVHRLLPDRLRFKIEYVADKFIAGGKKHYVARVDGKVKIVGYKAVKSSRCRAAQTLFRWLVDVLLDHGQQCADELYRDALQMYSHPEYGVDAEQFACRLSYSGKTYAEGTYMYNVVRCMRMRGVELVAGNSLSVVTVKTLQSYTFMYGRNPPIQLPTSNSKADRVYTLEEVAEHPTVVDVVEILETQCGSDLRSILTSTRVSL
jgi:hypothetical protein